MNRTIIPLLLLTLAACSQPRNNADNAEQIDFATLSVDEQFVTMAESSPGFAGLHYADEGGLIINVASAPGLSAQARSQFAVTEKVKNKTIDDIVARFGPEILTIGYASQRKLDKAKLSLGELKKTVKVQEVDYDYETLEAWFGKTVDILARDNVVSHDLDEANNRIVFGVENLALTGPIKQEIARLSVPLEAVQFKKDVSLSTTRNAPEEVKAASVVNAQALTVQSKQSVLRGGIQFENLEGGACTLGFIANRYGVPGFVTAGHCAQDIDSGVYAYMYQPTINSGSERNEVSYEYVEGNFRSTPRCPSGMRCKLSDSAFHKSLQKRSVEMGGFVETPTNTSITSANLTVTKYRDFDRDTTRSTVYVGTYVWKTGRTTGTTTGKVTATCANYEYSDVAALECEGRASYLSAGGDSGAPVYQHLLTSDGSGKIELTGIHHSRGGYFSPISDIETELGTLNNIAD